MNTNDPRFELIRLCREGEASIEELARLESMLREDAGFREAYVRYTNLDVALSSVAGAGLTPVETEVASHTRRLVWLQWRPITAAAAGLVFGLFCASVAWAYASPRVIVEARRLSALVDGSFEKQSGRVPSGFPVQTGVWRGDEAEIVGSGMVKARDGGSALRFLRAEGDGHMSRDAAEACDVYQIVDLRSLRGELKTTGESLLELSAEFLDARTEPGAPVLFACHIYLFEGSAESLQAVWPPTARDTSGVGANYILSSGGPDSGAWRKVTARCVLPPQVDVAVVKLSAGRGDRRGGSVPELGRQFVDDVQLILKTQPALAVRMVQN